MPFLPGPTSQSRRGYASLSKIVRPSQLERVLQRFEKSIPADLDDGETTGCIGAPSQFQINDPVQTNGIRWQVSFPDDEEEDPIEIEWYQEVAKSLVTVRVENPDDPQQYIITKRRTESVLQREDGTLLGIRWDNSNI